MQTYVGILKVRSGGRCTPALRLNLSRTIGNADLKRPNISPSSILIIRRLTNIDSKPLKLTRNISRPTRDWERNVNREIDDLYRRAARPLNGNIVGNPCAILFKDETEILACYLLSIIYSATSNWWWKYIFQLFPNINASSLSTFNVLIKVPKLVPAILNKLDDWGKAEKVLTSIDKDDVKQIVYAVLSERDLATFANKLKFANNEKKVITTLIPESQDTKERKENHQHALDQKDTKLLLLKRKNNYEDNLQTWIKKNKQEIQRHNRDYSFPVIQQYYNSVKKLISDFSYATGLSPTQNSLLLISRVIHKRPWLLHRNDLQEEIMSWWRREHPQGLNFSTEKISNQQNEINHQYPDNKPEQSKVGELKEIQRTQKEHNYLLKELHPSRQEDKNLKITIKNKAIGNKDNEFLENKEVSKLVNTGAQNKDKKIVSINTKEPIAIETDGISSTTNDEREVYKETKVHKETKVYKETTSEDQYQKHNELLLEEEFVTTRLGGVLYFINLIENLNIFELFNKDWRLYEQLSPWTMLEILTRGLLLNSAFGYQDDDLWKILAKLQNRMSDDPICNEYKGGEEYRIPKEWFAHIEMENHTFYWAALKKRLYIWLDREYLIADIYRDQQRPREQAKIELTNYANKQFAHRLTRKPLLKAPIFRFKKNNSMKLPTDLENWLCYILPYLRHRLFFSVSEQDKELRQMQELLFCPGKIYVTDTHIDFVTSMDNISIAARQSGIDKDPGWSPTFGRVIQFHFE